MEFRCNKLCKHIEEYLDARGHFVLVVAEGTQVGSVASLVLLSATMTGLPRVVAQVCSVDRAIVRGGEAEVKVDASGNKKLEDVGVLLDEFICKYFKARNKTINVKVCFPQC